MVLLLPTQKDRVNLQHGILRGKMHGRRCLNSMVTVVGHCVGEKKKEQTKYYIRLLLGIAYVAIFVVGVLLTIFSTPLLRFYGLSPDAFAIAGQLLLYHGIVSIFLSSIGAYALSCSLRAGKRKMVEQV